MIPLKPSNVHDPLQFDIGDDWLLEFDCHDANNNPLDLTAVQQIVWILKDYTTDEPILQLTIDAGVTVIPAVSPETFPTRVLVQVRHDQSDLIAPGFYRDRLRVITWTGIYTTQSRGRIEAVAT